MRIVWAICRKITKNCNYINKCQSVHQSTYQPFKKWASQLINLTVCLSVNQPFKQYKPVRYQSSHSGNQSNRIGKKLSRIGWRIKPCRTENKRLTHDWFVDNFTKTYSCNTTQHGYIRASNCMLGKRPIQVVKQMFYEGHLY